LPTVGSTASRTCYRGNIDSSSALLQRRSASDYSLFSEADGQPIRIRRQLLSISTL